MNEEEFIKEHPLLKGYLTEIPLSWISPIGGSNGNIIITNIKAVHETQIDKRRIKEVIKKITEKKRPEGEFVDGYRFKIELEQELGI